MLEARKQERQRESERRAALHEVAAEWSPHEHPEVAEYIERLSRDLAEPVPRK